MNNSYTANAPNSTVEGGDFISFSSNDNNSTTKSSNWNRTPFKSYSPQVQNIHDQFSPHGFSSPNFNQRNFGGNRRNQSGNSYGGRFRGNQSHGRGNNNWGNRNDNRRQPYNNQSFNKSGCGTVDISDYFHPSMIQDPWQHFQSHAYETSTTTSIDQNGEDKHCEDSSPETKDGNESGGSTTD